MNGSSGDVTPFPSDEDGESAGEGLPVIELETLLNRPPSRRKRLIQLGLALGAALVVLVTFWNVIVPPRPPGPVVHVLPTAKPPRIQVESNVSYGALSINGKALPGTMPMTIQLSTQPPYTITLNAPPFRPLTCPYPPTDIASRGTLTCSFTVTTGKQATDTLTMVLTLDDLPLAQQGQIKDLIPKAVTTQQALAVPAQSHIVTGLNADGTVKTRLVSGPLHASVSLVPSTQSLQGPAATFCEGFFCYNEGGFQAGFPASPHVWGVSTPVALRLRFTSADGQVVSDVTFSSASLLALFLSYDAATGWQARPASGSLSDALAHLVCATGAQMLLVERARYLSGGGWDAAVLSDYGAAGCELKLTQQAVDKGHFVWRFGALLAADAKAHNMLPLLPVASPAELAAVG